MANLFHLPKNMFTWTDIRAYFVRNQYNEILARVVRDYFESQYPDDNSKPNFLNTNHCLTLVKCDNDCDEIPEAPSISKGNAPTTEKIRPFLDVIDGILALKLDIKPQERTLLEKIKTSKEDIDKILAALNEDAALVQKDPKKIPANGKYKSFFEFLRLGFELGKETDNKKTKQEENDKFFKAKKDVEKLVGPLMAYMGQSLPAYRNAEENVRSYAYKACSPDYEKQLFCIPDFQYRRLFSLQPAMYGGKNDKDGHAINAEFFKKYLSNSGPVDYLSGLTVGSVLWLYYYERMGIFKIQAALMDDYNYKGRYTISGSRFNESGSSNSYSELLDMVCTLHRLGVSSNQKDRICTYQRVVGVGIDNNLGIESELNAGFFSTFNKLISYMLGYYKDKRLSVAIRDSTSGRSSVATQTAIKDTINLLRQQFEPFQYGRNQINTFLGIATVHATICLLYNIKREIGIPDQYDKPEEFIPAAYDILVAKRSATLNDTNRYIVHDYCASYGYRLLTDIETIDVEQLSVGGTGSVLDLWLDDIEGWVESYHNAYASIEEKASAMV